MSDDITLMNALRILARDVECEDGAANQVLHEAAVRFAELVLEHNKAQEPAITQIICPHCGHRHDDSHEWGQYGRDMNDDGIDDCEMCNEEIRWSRTVTTTYTAEKV